MIGNQVAPAVYPEVLGEVIVIEANYHRMNPLIRKLSSFIGYIVLKKLRDNDLLPHLIVICHDFTVWRKKLSSVYVDVVPLLKSE